MWLGGSTTVEPPQNPGSGPSAADVVLTTVIHMTLLQLQAKFEL